MERQINVELEEDGFSLECSDEKAEGKTRRQWLVLLVLGTGNLLVAACISLQAPFYPREAESKDLTPKEYGVFFGSYYFTAFVFSIICAKLLTRVSPRLMFNVGIFTTGTCYVLFGVLHHCPEGWPYETLSFVVRFVEGIGSAACKTACTTIVMTEFPDSVPSAFASIETYFGVGLLLGPVVGGAIYENKGYPVPFFAFGAGLLLCTLISIAILPGSADLESSQEPKFRKAASSSSSSNLRQVSLGAASFLCHGEVLLQVCSVVVATMCVGYNQAALEPHLRQFSLRPVAVGLVFVVSGGLYALSSPVWGSLCEQEASPKVLSAVGCILISFSFLIIGPVSFINVDTQLWMIVFALVVFGMGLGASLVSGFVDIFRVTISRGFPNSLSTYALASSLYSAAVAFGYFAGPCLGGYLLETIGYRDGTAYFLLAECVLVCMFSLSIICDRNTDDWLDEPVKNEKTRLLVDVSSSYNGTFQV